MNRYHALTNQSMTSVKNNQSACALSVSYEWCNTDDMTKQFFDIKHGLHYLCVVMAI